MPLTVKSPLAYTLVDKLGRFDVGPGKGHRKGITLKQTMRQFRDNAAAEAWFFEQPGRKVCAARSADR